MNYQLDLTFDQAATLAATGAWIRRWGWVDRWLFLVAGLWWLKPNDGPARVVRATDFTRVEFEASDFTTMYPDQIVCLPVPPPEPEPQPGPAGPITKYFAESGNADRPRGGFRSAVFYGTQTVANPFSTDCTVEIVANWLDDGLAVNGIQVTTPGGNYYAGYSPLFVYRFPLFSGGSFTIAAADHYGGIWQYGLAITFTP